MPTLDRIAFPLVGANHIPGALDFIKTIVAGNEPVQLIPDPENIHDPEAIKVYVYNTFIGYVPNKGYTCSHCGGSYNQDTSRCNDCEYSDYEVGGVAHRLHKLGILNSNYEAICEKFENPTSPIMLLKIIIFKSIKKPDLF
jgi:hypothetical protein